VKAKELFQYSLREAAKPLSKPLRLQIFSLFGILPKGATLEKIKEERLNKI
jgi:hypothetical protein